MTWKGSLARIVRLVVLVPLVLLGAGSGHAADEVFNATSVITIPGTPLNSVDISFVDPVLGLYFLADRSHKAVDVIETSNNTLATQLGAGSFTGTAPCVPPAGPNDCAGPNGVLTVNHREAWVGNGDSTIRVFDLATQALTHTIFTGGTKRADELCFDPRDQLVLMANDADSPPFVTFIPTAGPNAYTVVKTITMDGTHGTPNATNGIEQCQWSRRTGKFYLNIPEVNGPGDDSKPGAVLVISPETMEIEKTINLPHDKCAGPQGMAIGPDEQILLGCNASSSSVIINERSGAVIATLKNEGGPDEVWFNDGDDHYFLARSSAAPQQLGVVDARDHHEDLSRTTGSGTAAGKAHSVAADPVKNQVYVPIPGTAGSTVCSSASGGAASDAQGCIAVFTTGKDDRRSPK